MPRSDVGLTRVISRSEAHTLMRVARNDRDRLLALVLWTTGCRISEAICLRACDVLVEDAALRLPNRKQSDKRAEKWVVVSDDVLNQVQHYVESERLEAADWLFPGREPGKHLSVRQARNIIYTLADRAHVQLPRPRDGTVRPIWPHVLRHSYVTHLLRSGVDLLAVAEQAGHSNIANTRKYAHLVTADRRSAVQTVRF